MSNMIFEPTSDYDVNPISFDEFVTYYNSNQYIVFIQNKNFEWMYQLGYKDFYNDAMELNELYKFYKVEDDYISIVEFKSSYIEKFLMLSLKCNIIKNDQILMLMDESFQNLDISQLFYNQNSIDKPSRVEFEKDYIISSCIDRGNHFKRKSFTFSNNRTIYQQFLTDSFYISMAFFENNSLTYLACINKNKECNLMKVLEIASIDLPTLHNIDRFENNMTEENFLIVQALLI